MLDVDLERLGAVQHQSSWADVQRKGKRIADSGNVTIKHKRPYDIYQPEGIIETQGMVRGDNANYSVVLHQAHPRSRSVRWWDCQCTWRRYVWNRRPKYVVDRNGISREINKRFEGRVCSHVLALWWVGSVLPVEYEDVPEEVMTPEMVMKLLGEKRLWPEDEDKLQSMIDESLTEIAEEIGGGLELWDLSDVKQLPAEDILLEAERSLSDLKEQMNELQREPDSPNRRMQIDELQKKIDSREKQINFLKIDLKNKSIHRQLQDRLPAKMDEYLDLVEGDLFPKPIKSLFQETYVDEENNVWQITKNKFRGGPERIDPETREILPSLSWNLSDLAKSLKDSKKTDEDYVSVRDRRTNEVLIIPVSTAEGILSQRAYFPEVYVEDVGSFMKDNKSNIVEVVREKKKALKDIEDPKLRSTLQKEIQYFESLIKNFNYLLKLDDPETKSYKQEIIQLKEEMENTEGMDERDAYWTKVRNERKINNLRSLIQQKYRARDLAARTISPFADIGEFDDQPNLKAETPLPPFPEQEQLQIEIEPQQPDAISQALEFFKQNDPDRYQQYLNAVADNDDDTIEKMLDEYETITRNKPTFESSIKHSYVSVLSTEDISIKDIMKHLQIELMNEKSPKAYVRRELWGEQRGGLYPHPDAVAIAVRPDGNLVFSPDDLGYHPEIGEMGHIQEERGTYGSIPVGGEVSILAIDPRDRLVHVQHSLDNPTSNHQHIKVWIPLKDIDLI